MANRRMFSLDVVNTDKFLDMPTTSQNLYFHLGMRADDDGFISSPKRITRLVNCSEDDLNILVAKGYLLQVGDGIVVITHWKRNNYIQSDRKKDSIYQKQLSLLNCSNGVYELDTSCIQPVPNSYPQYSIGKDSIDKINISCTTEPCETESLEAFYDSIWNLYPIKKGKGQVSRTKKQVLQRIGYDQMKRCVERFVKDMESEHRDRKYWMHGSTFFNSGYVDYLDKNYMQSGIESIPPVEKPVDPEDEELVGDDW